MHNPSYFLFSALLTLALIGCEPGASSTPTCTPQSCPGCCDQTGQCQTGTGDQICGSLGGVCIACAQGQKCQLGRCVPNNPCDGCTGCCQNNQCLPGSSNSACGRGSTACMMCASDEVCAGGVCIRNTPPSACNPSNCAGCCQGELCVAAPTNQQCGANGTPCSSCGLNQECKYGACSDAGCSSCAAQNGCCRDNSCFRGDSPSACGFGGAACSSCAAGERCVSGRCEKEGVQTCDWKTCWGGCCREDGSCQIPFNDQACGIAGVPCRTCNAYERCELGNCTRPPAGGVSCGLVTCSAGNCCKYGLYCVDATSCAPGECNCSGTGSGGVCNPACQYPSCCNNGICQQVGSGQCPQCTNGICYGSGTYCNPACYGSTCCGNGYCQQIGSGSCPSCNNGICYGANGGCSTPCTNGYCCNGGACQQVGTVGCTTCLSGICQGGGTISGLCEPDDAYPGQCCNGLSAQPVSDSAAGCGGCTYQAGGRVCNSERGSGRFVEVCIESAEINCSQTTLCDDDYFGTDVMEVAAEVDSGSQRSFRTGVVDVSVPNLQGTYTVAFPNGCTLITQLQRIQQAGLQIKIGENDGNPIGAGDIFGAACNFTGVTLGSQTRFCDSNNVIGSIRFRVQPF